MAETTQIHGSSSGEHYYEELNLFRGITIFFIVFAHFHYMFMLKRIPMWSSFNHIMEMLWGAFMSGGSWFFVFISGFLFHAIFFKRGLVYKKFLVSKIKKVFIPYFIFATAFLILRFCVVHPNTIDSNYILSAYFYWSFWYVPFIMCIFLMTPVFLVYLDLSKNIQLAIFVFSLIIAIGVGKHTSNPILSCVFYIPAYLLGILASVFYQKIITLDIKMRWAFFYIVIMYLVCLISTQHVWEPQFGTWDIKFFQKPCYIIIVKLSFCFFFIWSLRWLHKKSYPFLIKPINLLAKYSFTIFFFHQFPLFYLDRHPHVEFFKAIPYWPRMVLIFWGSLAVCFLIILIFAPFKKILGKHSRMIIGC